MTAAPPTRAPNAFVRGVLGLAAVVLTMTAGTAAAQVSNADQICPASADPCVITQQIDVADGALLDFGLRAVEIRPGGGLLVGSGTVTLRCGRFSTFVGGTQVINARGSVLGGGSAGGTLTIEVRGTCSGAPSRRCIRSADCRLGACLGTFCRNDPTVPCSSDMECDFGMCEGPGATFDLDGKIRASADEPGSVTIAAVGDVTIGALVTTSSTNIDSDGGDIDIESTAGSLTVDGRIEADGGANSGGGSVTLGAGTSVTFNTSVTSNGGDFGGGSIDVLAGADIVVSALLSATSTVLGGDGGSIDVSAGRDLVIGPTGELRASGHADATGFAGFGGDFTLEAGRNATIANGARLVVEGSRPDGDGGFVDILVDGDVSFAGTISARARGSQGGGGEVTVDACGVFFESTALVDVGGDGGDTDLTGHDTIELASGSQILADALTGSHTISYRRADRPPVLAGTIDPLPTVTLRPALSACATCGNARLEEGETCDDGGVVAGDGCSGDCQLETCIAQTPGYPQVPLCDDGQGCTMDVCEVSSGNCSHTLSCDDGIPCTVDSCDGTGSCVHAPDHAACDDGNSCTDDSCNLTSGCVHTANVNPCDDGVSCTTGDTCSAGVCVGTSTCSSGEVCDPVRDRCVIPGTTTTMPPGVCGDGLLGAGEQCDDGDTLWQFGEFCNASCRILSCGDPDDSSVVTASDALFTLRVAVGLGSCDPCICDVDSSGGGSPVTASDALRLLRRAVGQTIPLSCPACP